MAWTSEQVSLELEEALIEVEVEVEGGGWRVEVGFFSWGDLGGLG